MDVAQLILAHQIRRDRKIEMAHKRTSIILYKLCTVLPTLWFLIEEDAFCEDKLSAIQIIYAVIP